MAVTQNIYTGNGSTVLYSFTFPYLEEDHVKVTLDGLPTTAYTFANATTIQFNTAPSNGVSIRIYRDTDDEQLRSEFFPGSAIRAQDLNENFIQSLYLVQESLDGVNPFDPEIFADFDFNGYRGINLGDPVALKDAVNKEYVDSRLGNLDAPATTYWRKVATAGQTVFTGLDEEGEDLIITMTREQVYLNGALQQRGVDYMLDSDTQITLIVPATVGDILTVFSFNYTTGLQGEQGPPGAVNSLTATSPLNSTGGADPVISVNDATTSQKGVVQLTDSTSSTSTTTAATPNSVKSAYDIASSALQPDDIGISVQGYDSTILKSSDIGNTVQGYDADTAKLDTVQTWPAAQTFGDNVTVNAQKELRLADADSSNYVGFKAPATVSTNIAWTLPSADGSANQILQTNGAGVLGWATAAAGAANDVQEFTTSGTWTKPAGAKFVLVEAWGAGGGGGSGGRRALADTSSAGSGGSGGAYFAKMFKASDLTSTVSVTVGAAGVGGSAITVDSTNGNPGTDGGNTTFGSYVTAFGGTGGLAGSTSATIVGTGGAGSYGRGSADLGGEPRFILSTSLNASASNAAGGGTSISNYAGNSVYGGGAGAYYSGTSFQGGSSVYGGAGGSSGGGLSSSSTIGFLGAPGASGFFGSSGAGGNPQNASPTSVQWTQASFGNNTYIANNSNFIATSSNGTTWASLPGQTSAFIDKNLRYGNGVWIYWGLHVGGLTTTIYQSTDLLNWTVAGTVNFDVNDIWYNSGIYVAVGNGGAIFTSTNLSSWTSRTSGVTTDLGKVVYDGAKWIAVGPFSPVSSVAVLTSTDAITWALAGIEANLYSWHDFASNGASNYVATGYLSPNVTYSTNGGATWTNTSTALSGAGSNAFSNSSVAFGAGLFVLINGANIWTSPTGQTWTVRTNPSGNTLRGLVFANGLFFAGSNTYNSNAGLTSPDGITWTTRTFTAGTSSATAGGNGASACGGGGGGASRNGNNSGAGGNGGAGLCRVYTW